MKRSKSYTNIERERVGEWKREADSATERPLAYLAGVHCSLRSTCLRLVSAAVATWTVAGPSAEVIGQGERVREKRWGGYFGGIVSSSPTCLPIGNNTVSLVLLSSVWFIMQRVAQCNRSPSSLPPPTNNNSNYKRNVCLWIVVVAVALWGRWSEAATWTPSSFHFPAANQWTPSLSLSLSLYRYMYIYIIEFWFGRTKYVSGPDQQQQQQQKCNTKYVIRFLTIVVPRLWGLIFFSFYLYFVSFALISFHLARNVSGAAICQLILWQMRLIFIATS